MRDALTLWLQVRELNLSDPDAAGDLIRELEAMPDAASAIETSMSAGTAYGTLRVLERDDAQSLALQVLRLLVYWVGETQMHLDHVRKVIRGLPREELEVRLWPVMEGLLDLEDSWVPLRFAELLMELGLREPLEQLLAVVAESDNEEVLEVAEEFDRAWDTPAWGQPL